MSRRVISTCPGTSSFHLQIHQGHHAWEHRNPWFPNQSLHSGARHPPHPGGTLHRRVLPKPRHPTLFKKLTLQSHKNAVGGSHSAPNSCNHAVGVLTSNIELTDCYGSIKPSYSKLAS